MKRMGEDEKVRPLVFQQDSESFFLSSSLLYNICEILFQLHSHCCDSLYAYRSVNAYPVTYCVLDSILVWRNVSVGMDTLFL